MCIKVNENNRQIIYKHEKGSDEIDEQSKAVIEVFINNKLRTIVDNCNCVDT